MNVTRLSLSSLALLGIAAAGSAQPVASDPRLVIELVARQPDIKTPTGIAVDERGRVWVIENNTHFRPKDYDGHPSDRILIFEDLDEHGKARKRSTFADGFKDSMSIALHRDAVYLATRSDIFVLKDTDGDGKADEKKRIVRLETKGNYPHNGLSGFAFDPLGNMYFSLGENLGVPYKLIGSDGASLAGGGEGGNIYRARPDGSKLQQVATGFWNTYHLCFDAFGRLFAVDNDPDSRPPCRLLHIVQGGDYGYRFRNGRKGLHPFTAWNGELPGTLPMVAGTGEAPSGIVAYESTGLPAEYRGKLLVTSWGDHIVQCFTLHEKGASFSATATNLVQGGESFRPVGIAVGPDGALYLSDWVDRSYPIHGKGAIWRIRMKEPPRDDGLRPSQVGKLEIAKLGELLGHPKVEIRQAAGDVLVLLMRNNLGGEQPLQVVLDAIQHGADPRARLHALWAGAQVSPPVARRCLSESLRDQQAEVLAEAGRLFGMFHRRDEMDHRLVLQALAERKKQPAVRLHAVQQLHGDVLESALPYLTDRDPFLASAAINALSRADNQPDWKRLAQADDPRLRLGIALVLRQIDNAAARKAVPVFLYDADPAVRRAAIQWAAESGLKDLAGDLAFVASRPPVTKELFEAYLAAQEILAGKRWDEASGELYVLKVLEDARHPPAFHALALRMIRPDHPKIPPEKLSAFLKSQDEPLRREAVRTLALRTDANSQQVLRQLAADAKLPADLRADAIAGLTHSARSEPSRKLLFELLADESLRREALRALRGEPAAAGQVIDWWEKTAAKDRELAAQVVRLGQGNKELGDRLKPIAELAGPRPANPADWLKVLGTDGDAAAGERLFFHPKGPACFACHRVNGRGGLVGPDLSKIAASANRDRLIESIVQPSKEIAPQFTTYAVETKAGQVHTGLIVAEDPRGELVLADALGKLVRIKLGDIEERRALPASIMPENVHELMTPAEVRDLIAFLSTLK